MSSHLTSQLFTEYPKERIFSNITRYKQDGYTYVVVPKGTKIYHGSCGIVENNVEKPLGINYYNPNSSQKNKKVDISYYGDLSTAKNYASLTGDVLCINAYKIVKDLYLLDMLNVNNINLLIETSSADIFKLISNVYNMQTNSVKNVIKKSSITKYINNMGTNNYKLAYYLLERFPEGICYPYLYFQNGKYPEITLQYTALTHIQRDFSNENDWQYIEDKLLRNSIKLLVEDMYKYKTTNVNFHAGDLLEHSIWTALYLQSAISNKEEIVEGIQNKYFILTIISGFLHDIGKGGDNVLIFYDKPNHPEQGVKYIQSTYKTQNNVVIDFKDILRDLDIPQELSPILEFCVLYHRLIGELLLECKTITNKCILNIYRTFLDITKGFSFVDLSQLFRILFAIWYCDVLATQPYKVEYHDILLTNISNLPATHSGTDLMNKYNLKKRALKLREKVLKLFI